MTGNLSSLRLSFVLAVLVILFGCKSSAQDSLIVFIGSPIEVKAIPRRSADGSLRLDMEFEAKYKVEKVIFGNYSEPEIIFSAFDHYGFPQFASPSFKTVMLYLTRYREGLIHEKYQFYEVYPTADGRWAGCGDPYKYDEAHYREGAQTAHPIEFKPEVTFELTGLTASEIETRYPKKYFARRGPVVACIAGAYAEELFEVKRLGVLSSRGIFGNHGR